MPSSSASFSKPVLCVMILSEVFNIVIVRFDGLVGTTIKTDNHPPSSDVPPPFQLAEKAAVPDHIEATSDQDKVVLVIQEVAGDQVADQGLVDLRRHFLANQWPA